MMNDLPLQPVADFKRFRFHLDDVLLGQLEVPLRPEWVTMAGVMDAMCLPEPLTVGGRLQVWSLELRDIRSTDEWECSGLYFRLT